MLQRTASGCRVRRRHAVRTVARPRSDRPRARPSGSEGPDGQGSCECAPLEVLLAIYPRPMPPTGNVLFITVDQWRGDCLSAMGHPIVETPALDRLAADGVLFTNHWAQAAPCGPSRACLYTGTYLHQNRSVLNGTPLDTRLTNV